MCQKQRTFPRPAAASGHDQPHRRRSAQHPAQKQQPTLHPPWQQHRQQDSRRGNIMPHGGHQGGLEIILIFRRAVQLPHGSDDPRGGNRGENPQDDFQWVIHRQQIFHVHGHGVKHAPQNQRAAAQHDGDYGQTVLFACLFHSGILHGHKYPVNGGSRLPRHFFSLLYQSIPLISSPL